MTRAVTKSETPEERELAEKRARLAALEAQLAQRELDLHTLAAKLHAFELRYLQVVGRRLAQLDRLRADILEARAAGGDRAAQEELLRARERARASAEAAGMAARQAPSAGRFEPPDELKRLYREAARRIHPDLAADEAERRRRTRLMADLNRAFEEGDEERVRAILEDWEVRPEAVTGDDIGAELVRVIRKIAQVERRLEAIDREIAALEDSELYRLMRTVEEEEAEGGDPLGRIAAALDAEIEEARAELRRVKGEATTT